MPATVHIYLMASLVDGLRVMHKILTVGLPRWSPYLSTSEAAACAALLAAIEAVIALLPIPD